MDKCYCKECINQTTLIFKIINVNVVSWFLFPQNDCSTEDLHMVGAEDLAFLAGKVNFSCQNQYTMVNSLLPKSNSFTLL